MSVGLILPQGFNADLSGSPTEQYSLIKGVASEAEQLGFTSLWLQDHFISPARANHPCFECWTTLAALAAETRRIRLGTLVTCNSYRHPALVAKMAATLDSISNGRLEFGIGAGWHKREYVAYGFPYPSLDERTSMLRESVHLIKRMWTEDKVTFIGEHYRTHEAICEPKPVQKPHPPIWIGGKGRSTLKVAAAYADGCNFAAEPIEYLAKLELLKRYCDEIGRDHTQIRKSLYGRVILGRDEREVGSRLRAYASKVQIPVASKISIALRHPEKALSYVRKQIIQRKPPAAWIVGTPEQCSETLLNYKRMGAREFMLYIVDAAEREPLRLFADKVMPTMNPG